MSAATAAEAAPAPATCPPVIGEYPPGSGKPTITLRRDANDRYPFTFGIAKARLVVQHLDAIKRFVEANRDAKG